MALLPALPVLLVLPALPVLPVQPALPALPALELSPALVPERGDGVDEHEALDLEEVTRPISQCRLPTSALVPVGVLELHPSVSVNLCGLCLEQ